ncbi:hypothetical protein NDU88_004626 [Pleurodeles waltl]|uniref:Uncharacterized protein n=1 Tax=Pleurodeles waltl TaxID=8319 RepID=A0AAV7LV69_PLEWA|nr:hypothetical protein NDU88_004626 [Pleurodeles waltl]
MDRQAHAIKMQLQKNRVRSCSTFQDTHAAVPILIVALLGSIVAQADDDVNISNQGNDGGDVHQTVNIYNHETIININEFNGWNSWDSIFDFNRVSILIP